MIAEILSERTRKTDEVIKRKLYERFGVRDYWIVDPVVAAVTVYRLTQNGYTRTAILSAEKQERLITPLLPELEVFLSSLFHD